MKSSSLYVCQHNYLSRLWLCILFDTLFLFIKWSSCQSENFILLEGPRRKEFRSLYYFGIVELFDSSCTHSEYGPLCLLQNASKATGSP